MHFYLPVYELSGKGSIKAVCKRAAFIVKIFVSGNSGRLNTRLYAERQEQMINIVPWGGHGYHHESYSA
jgi:hypothetical protein